MFKRILIVILAVLCISLVIKINSQTSFTEMLCQNSIIHSYQSFLNYSQTADGQSYIRGVAEFKAFMGHYQSLNPQKNLDTYNVIYSILAYNQNLVKENIVSLVEALAYFYDDYDDMNGKYKLMNFRNLIDYKTSNP